MSAREPLAGHHPARPSLSPVFICALAFWALCAASYAPGVAFSEQQARAMAVASAASALAFALLALVGKVRTFALVGVAAALGFCLGAAQAASMHGLSNQLDGFSGECEVQLLEDSSNSGFGENALVQARLPDGTRPVLSARFGDSQPLYTGERLICTGAISALDYERYPFAWASGSCGSLKVSQVRPQSERGVFAMLIDLRIRAVQGIRSDTDAQRLVQALACGYRRGIAESEAYSQYQSCGLAHLVAVSGAHLVLVTGLLASALRAVRAPRRMSIALVICAMAAYFVIAGMPVSALRAVIMSTLGLVSFFGKRRASSLNAIGIGIFAIVLANPSSCISASFVLSGLSTVGIVVFAPLVQSWLEDIRHVGSSFFGEAFSLTFSAGLLSQLYACSLFGQLPLVSPLANALAAPLFPFACGAGLVAALFSALFPVAGSAAVDVASIPSLALTFLVEHLAKVPYASVPISIGSVEALVISFAAAIILWAWWPRKPLVPLSIAFACAVIAAVALLNMGSAGDRVVMLDVGQGDAILVKSRGASLLVDTGNHDSNLLEQLGRNQIAHIGTVLVTHADDDHCGSLDALRKAVEVDRIVLAGEMQSCDGESARSLMREAFATAPIVEGLNRGDAFAVGAFTARVVWPESFTEDGGNADSLCILLTYDGDDDGVGDFTTFMTGDAEKDQLQHMLKEGLVGHVDVLKVGHHGSRNGATLEQMRVLSPQLALISCGAHNRYGHPTQETLDMLDDVGARTYRTDQDGTISCSFSPEGITVSCAR